MLIGKPPDIPSSEITPRDAYLRYLSRRRFLKGAAAAGAAVLGANRVAQLVSPRTSVFAGTKLQTVQSPLTTTGEQLTPFDDITHYNNFYEFGVNKGRPRKKRRRPSHASLVRQSRRQSCQAAHLRHRDLLKLHPLEDRVYRHRCVEAWSMVIPWVGYSLSEFIKQCNPLPSAKYVQFLSYFDRRIEKWAEEDATIYWPYSEGLRMDEAMNPLTLLTFGLYGETLPNQDGAPIRIVVPWKYGFKSAKSIVDREVYRQGAADNVERPGAQRIRLLLQRESRRRPPALEPENRAPHRTTVLRTAPHYPHVQRLLRPGRFNVRGHEPAQILLRQRRELVDSLTPWVPQVSILRPGTGNRALETKASVPHP